MSKKSGIVSSSVIYEVTIRVLVHISLIKEGFTKIYKDFMIVDL